MCLRARVLVCVLQGALSQAPAEALLSQRPSKGGEARFSIFILFFYFLFLFIFFLLFTFPFRACECGLGESREQVFRWASTGTIEAVCKRSCDCSRQYRMLYNDCAQRRLVCFAV